MRIVHVPTGKDAPTVARRLALVETLQSDGGRRVEKDNQINVTGQGLTPSGEGAGQYPSLGRTLLFRDQFHSLLRGAFDAERRVRRHPVEIIDIYERDFEPLCQHRAERRDTRAGSPRYVYFRPAEHSDRFPRRFLH
ncbi:hypothetical protein ABE454_05175 [Brevundimonas diminuta]